jgi:hypothetical protein
LKNGAVKKMLTTKPQKRGVAAPYSIACMITKSADTARTILWAKKLVK